MEYIIDGKKVEEDDEFASQFHIDVSFEPFDDCYSMFIYNKGKFKFNPCGVKHFLYQAKISVSDTTLSDSATIANIELYLVNLSDCVDYGENKVWLWVDDIIEDAEEIFMTLSRRKFMNNCYENERLLMYSSKVYVGGLHTLYVEPQYRKSNLGRSLIKNINNILGEFLNIQVAGLSAYVNPFDENKVYMHPERNVLTEEQELVVERLCKFLRYMGFKKIRNEKYYYFLDMTNTVVYMI